MLGAPIAARPDHWTPARDAGSVAEYVTLDIGSHGWQGKEVDDILTAVERCNRVSWLQVELTISADAAVDADCSVSSTKCWALLTNRRTQETVGRRLHL